MKKFLSILLAAMMVLATAGVAFAEGEGETTTPATTYTITINNAETGYTYKAYQIFAGDLSGEILSNIVWGDGITDAGKEAAYALYGLTGDNQTAAKVADELMARKGNTEATAATAADAFARVIAGYVQNPDEATVPTDGKYLLGNLDAGYYLVVNTAGADILSKYIMEVVANTEVTPKVGTVPFEKKVKDINDSTETEMTGWQDSADHDVGDDVPFKLEGGLPATFDAFARYGYKFTDVLSNGLTFNSDSLKVYVVNGTTRTEVDSSCYVVSGLTAVEGGNQFTVTFDSLKAYEVETTGEDGSVTKETKGGLYNNGTKIDVTAASKIVVEYTAKLNENSVIGNAGNPNTAKLEYATNPYWNGTGDEPTNETEWDNVIVFTYKLKIYKYSKDAEGNKVPLKDAQFTLYKKNPAGEYVQVAVMTPNTDTETVGSIDWVAGTVFTYERLDDGEYKIEETVTPAGYNTIVPVIFTVTAEHEILVTGTEVPELTSITATDPITEVTLTTGEGETAVTTYTGELTTEVENKSGATLPETGGIGTTLFYLIGGLMAAGSALTLVIRRRADADEE